MGQGLPWLEAEGMTGTGLFQRQMMRGGLGRVSLGLEDKRTDGVGSVLGWQHLQIK